MAEGKTSLPDLIAPELRDDELRRDAAWADVTSGRRSADEVAAERLAAGDSPEEIELARLLYTPRELDEGFFAGHEPAANDPGREVVEARAKPASARGRWLIVLAGLAAAIVLLMLLPRDDGGRSDVVAIDDGAAPVAAKLPAYSVETDAGLEIERGDPAPAVEGGLRYKAANRFEWTMRPAVDVVGAVDLRLCLTAADGEARPLELDAGLVERGSAGGFQVHGPVRALGLAPGRWTVTLIVARPDALVDLDCATPEGEGRRIGRVEFELVA